jgi:hypothetical protein
MCLIYENAIKYHTETSFWGCIASQLLHDFKHSANGFRTQSDAEWTDLLVAETRKLGQLISASPVKHGADLLISSCVHRAEGMPKYPRDGIPELIARLDRLLERDDVRANVLTMVKQIQKEPPITTDNDIVIIDVEKLKDHALHAINLYVRALE